MQIHQPFSSAASFGGHCPQLPIDPSLFGQPAPSAARFLEEEQLVNNEAVGRVFDILPKPLHDGLLAHPVVLVTRFAQVVIRLLEGLFTKGADALPA